MISSSNEVALSSSLLLIFSSIQFSSMMGRGNGASDNALMGNN